MFSLTISFGPGPVMWTLMFKTEESANAAAKGYDNTVNAGSGRLILIDDFGQTLNIEAEALHGSMLEDMELSKLAHIERALHQGRTQAKAQEMAEGDAVLRAARFKQGGPAVISPMGPGFNNGYPGR